MHRVRTEIALAAAVALALMVPLGGAPAQERSDECYAPPSVMWLGRPLQHAGSRLRHGLPIKIVAIGSSSTAGIGASDAAHAYPQQLAAELARRFPASAVTVLNKGVGGEQTEDMLVRFGRDVIAEHPDLVVWQTGSNEILRNGNPELFRRRVLDGIARLKAAGVDTILMDAQYAPRLLDNPEYPVFNDALRGVARTSRVALLDRFEAMRFWLGPGHQPWSHMIDKDQVHMTDAGYHCLGSLLASLIAADLPKVASR